MDHCRIGRLDVRCRAIAKCTILLVAISILAGLMFEAAYSKTPGKTFCFVGKCHRVKTLAEMQAMVGQTVTLHASHYNDAKLDRYNPSNITSSGELFRFNRPDNAASPIYPDGTTLLLWNPATKQSAVVRINNAGPYWGNRNLDVSRATAERLGFARQGVATLRARILSAPTRAEATYRRGRTYPPVQGYLGQFASLDLAAQSLGRSRTAPPRPSVTGTTVAAAGRQPARPSTEVPVASAAPAAAGAETLAAPEVEATPVPVPVAAAAAATPAPKKALLKVAQKRQGEGKRAQVRQRAKATTTVALRSKAKASTRTAQRPQVSPTRMAASIRDTRARPQPGARDRGQVVADARRPLVSTAAPPRQRMAEADIRRPRTSGLRCRPGFSLRTMGSDSGQVRVMCVAMDGEASRSSRSVRPSPSERSFNVASARNRS